MLQTIILSHSTPDLSRQYHQHSFSQNLGVDGLIFEGVFHISPGHFQYRERFRYREHCVPEFGSVYCSDIGNLNL
jgi:hypothetical protein